MAEKKTISAVDENIEINYEIKIMGHLENHWSDWLIGLEITRDKKGHRTF